MPSPSEKPKLPWSSRWSLFKNLLLKGVLPSNWGEWAEIYQVGDVVPLGFKVQFGDRSQRRKDWVKALEEKHKTHWSMPKERALWREALMLEWYDNAPSSRARDAAQFYWDKLPADKRRDAWVDWKCFGYSDQPDTVTDLDWSTLSESEKTWLLGWVMAVSPYDSSQVLDLWKEHASLKLTKTLTALEWAIVFNRDEVIKEILDSHPPQMDVDTQSKSLYVGASSYIKQLNLSFNLKYIQIPEDKMGLAYQAIWWGANSCLREICLRGGASPQYQNIIHNKVMFQHALEKQNTEALEILLNYAPLVRSPVDKMGYSPIHKFAQMFGPDYSEEDKQFVLELFKKTLAATDAHASLKWPIALEKELVLTLYSIVLERREPLAMKALVEHLDAHPALQGWHTMEKIINPETPGFDATKQRKKLNVLDICLDQGCDPYMATLAGGHFNLTPRLFYHMLMCVPGALPTWLEKASTQEIQALLQGKSPELLGKNFYFDCVPKSNARPTWKEGDSMWEAALKSRNPGVALSVLCSHPDLATTWTDTLWAKCFGGIWALPPQEANLALDALLKARESVPMNTLPPCKGLNTLLSKDLRNLKWVDDTTAQHRIPWTHPVDDQGNTVLHGVIQNQDLALFEILLKHNVSFEVPNHDGLTPLALALKKAPDLYQRLVAHQKAHLQETLNDSPLVPASKNHRL